MHTFSNRSILRRKTERIESLRMQHVVTFHALEPSRSVAAREREPVADVQVTRGIREHRLDEPLRPVVRIWVPAIQPGFLPFGALLRLNRRGIVRRNMRGLLWVCGDCALCCFVLHLL